MTSPPPRNQMCWLSWRRTILFGHVLVAGLRHVPLRCGWGALGLLLRSESSNAAILRFTQEVCYD
jgi:hypothetical protein